MKKKIAICHYRVGGTDGVSLEIEKRKQILEKHNCEVKLIAGTRSYKADYTIRELEWDSEIIPRIKENSFLSFDRKDFNDEEIKEKKKEVTDKIRKKLDEIQKKEKFNYVLVHNIFSFGGHTAAAKAFKDWIEEFKLPTIATHHDFFWERKEFHTPRNDFIKQYLKKYMPPKSPYITHVVINSLAKRGLKERNNIESVLIPDVFDFSQPQWAKDSFNGDFLEQFDIKPNDLIVLQATRVIPRKGIELAIDFAKRLEKKIKKLRGKKIYNNKQLGKKANIVLIIAGYTEGEKRIYMFKIKTKCFEEQVHAKFVSSSISAKRSYHNQVKTYSLWDAYVYADLVTFPSIWEGWGNQFIEGVFAKKPMVVFEYPVFKKDIKPEGYKYISLGDELLKKDENGLCKISQKAMDEAVKKTIRWLLNKNLNRKLDLNFKIGQKNHDYKDIESFLVEKLELDLTE